MLEERSHSSLRTCLSAHAKAKSATWPSGRVLPEPRTAVLVDLAGIFKGSIPTKEGPAGARAEIDQWDFTRHAPRGTYGRIGRSFAVFRISAAGSGSASPRS